ncbi:hypothetical protein [Caldifermentibacillus hisashii]|uniref:hypothetical protein n=1 Tax=Caldifermentibacillus hisashii TaxID=996558 RepID=UPI0031014C96
MGKLTSMLQDYNMSLIVSLPSNDLELAKAAIAGGADGIKVHINVSHRASGNTFGSLAENRKFFEALTREFSGPIGVVPGGSIDRVQEAEIKELEELGISYYSIYMDHMPSFMLNTSMDKTVAGHSDFHLDTLRSLNGTAINAFEASIINGDEYGTPLNFQDLLNYKSIVDTLEMPVIVPSQRKLTPNDIPHLAEVGIKGIMIGAVVTGKDRQSIERETREMRKMINR